MIATTATLTRITMAFAAGALIVTPATRVLATAVDDDLDLMARQPSVSWIAQRFLEAELVEKGERGWMDVITRYDRERGLSHTVVSEGGSQRIRARALSNVLDEEVAASRTDAAKRSAFTRENYRYRLVDAPWDVARIELMPLREDARLVKGTAMVDARSGRLLKVEGQLARSPSFWVRDVQVARTYAFVGGATLPVELVSTARVRLFGAARLRISTRYLSVEGRPVGAPSALAARSARVARADP